MDSYPILIDDVRCSTSSFLVILQCQHSFVVDQNCVNGRDDVSVHCSKYIHDTMQICDMNL